jgi:hypothetical protein
MLRADDQRSILRVLEIESGADMIGPRQHPVLKLEGGLALDGARDGILGRILR